MVPHIHAAHHQRSSKHLSEVSNHLQKLLKEKEMSFLFFPWSSFMVILLFLQVLFSFSFCWSFLTFLELKPLSSQDGFPLSYLKSKYVCLNILGLGGWGGFQFQENTSTKFNFVRKVQELLQSFGILKLIPLFFLHSKLQFSLKRQKFFLV